LILRTFGESGNTDYGSADDLSKAMTSALLVEPCVFQREAQASKLEHVEVDPIPERGNAPEYPQMEPA
jgi:hypothetical protein